MEFIKNGVFLAPMAGITDKAFRVLCEEQGASMTFTEMVNCKGMYYDDKKTFKLLEVFPKEKNVGVQIFGKDPDIMADIVSRLNETRFSVIDINMGCPAPKITKNGEGSALLLNPDLIGKIVRAVVKVSKKPVTVKIRKGYDDDNINAVYVAKVIEEAGASAITVHGRTKKQQYSGVADWDTIREVKKAVSIPVIGNGDVVDFKSAERMFLHTGCDAIMIGRGALGNPWIFREIFSYIKNGTVCEKPSLEQKIECIIRQLDMMMQYKNERTAVCEMRKHIGWYLKGVRNSSKIKEHLFKIKGYNELVFEVEKLRYIERDFYAE